MLSRIILHKVGNKITQEQLFLSENELHPAENVQELLTDFFLNAFKSEEQFQFYGEPYLSANRIFALASQVFEETENFVAVSQKIARHLYDVAENPRIQGGELFVVFFEGGVTEEGKTMDSLGIFKTEKKLPFLQIEPQDDDYTLFLESGISLAKIDKGCLIYNTDRESGFAVSVVDNNKNGAPEYWFEDFLKVRQRDDEYFHTEKTLTVFKDYVTRQLPQEFEVNKPDQAEFLNKSLQFFKDRETFDFEEFTTEVLQDQNVIESFVNYKTDYEQEMQVSISEEFPINETAVKKNQRYFKSVIKLDKNFHIYVHGDRKKIEQGKDENGKYYRLYFDEEQ